MIHSAYLINQLEIQFDGLFLAHVSEFCPRVVLCSRHKSHCTRRLFSAFSHRDLCCIVCVCVRVKKRNCETITIFQTCLNSAYICSFCLSLKDAFGPCVTYSRAFLKSDSDILAKSERQKKNKNKNKTKTKTKNKEQNKDDAKVNAQAPFSFQRIEKIQNYFISSCLERQFCTETRIQCENLLLRVRSAF
jgi:hypothetical protein